MPKKPAIQKPWITDNRKQKLGPVGREGRFITREAYQEAPRANTMDPDFERPDADLQPQSLDSKPGTWEERGTGRG